MDRKYIDEQHVVARYLADQLSEEEREGFEAYWDEHPDVLAELEATARFKVALAVLAESGLLESIIKVSKRSGEVETT